LSHLGFLDYLEGRQSSARALYQEGLELAREANDPDAVAEFLDNLGRTFQVEEDVDGAVRAYQEAEAIWREIGQAHRLAMVLNNLGSVLTLRGEFGAARRHLAEALGLSQRIGNRRRLAFTLEAVATLAAVEGEAERALRLDAVASAAVAEMGATLTQPINALGARHIERARQVLGATASGAAVAAGRAMTLTEAVEDALTWLAAPKGCAPVGTRPAREARQPVLMAARPVLAAAPASTGVARLSRREFEVAALVARGMTNRQIAETLTISPHTAERHVEHILAKLDCSSRAEIAAWAIRNGPTSEPS
jgi:non-specific serine/threonine protein kinase